jgi:serine phosphatase RsbU (regulator of sigma subunit)
VDAPRPSGADAAPDGPEPASRRPTRADAGRAADARDRIRRLALLVLPGTWIVTVLILALTVGSYVQVTPLLAAAPAIACTGTGRRQCIVLSAACALFALLPIAGAPAELGQRAGTSLSILAVAAASYLIAQRRLRLQRAYEHVQRIADVTQKVLLRPVPERIGAVAAAVGYLSAAPGARVGGDFYDVLETPFGIRAILGDVRGCGLDALSGAAAVLGAFREAASYENDLDTVAHRLDAALARHATARRTDGDEGPDLRAEDFATAVLLEIREAIAGESGEQQPQTEAVGTAPGTISIVSCGHPAPYLLKPGQLSAEPLDTSIPAPPLGLYALEASAAVPRLRSVPFDAGSTVVVCTDGILDARDRDGAFFPVADVLNAAAPSAPTPKAVVRLVQERLLVHTTGMLKDDAAVLVLSHVGAP